MMLLLPLTVAGLAILVDNALSSPKPSAIPERETIGSMTVEQVSFASADELTLRGWLIRTPGTRAVVLLHGLGANRIQHLAKAELYVELGFSVLTYDARCHGASDCSRITGGLEERLDLEAAVEFMRAEGYDTLGLDGFSMGAATITFVDQDAVAPAFVVLESSYKDMPTLIRNAAMRMHLPAAFAMPVLWRMGMRLGDSIETISPIHNLAKVSVPTLMLLGDSEFQVSPNQAREMFDVCAAKVKQIYIFEHAGHEIFCETQGDLYEHYLKDFLAAAGMLGATPRS
jgi:alpha-beta hydrolase superfamily lysophospholipase